MYAPGSLDWVCMARKRDSNGNIIYRESDKIYNERRRARRRLVRMERDFDKVNSGKKSYEVAKAKAELRNLREQIQKSYAKTNPEGYKGVIDSIARDNARDFSVRQDKILENRYAKEFSKLARKGYVDDVQEAEYISMRKGGVEWFTGSTKDNHINVVTGEVMSDEQMKIIRQEAIEQAMKEESVNYFKGTNIQPVPENQEQFNHSMNSMFNLAMKYADKQKYGEIDLDNLMITEEDRRTFFALVQPFRAQYDIDNKELYNAITEFIRAHDKEAHIYSHYDMMDYVLHNKNWLRLTAGTQANYDEWLNNTDLGDEAEVIYNDIAIASAKIAQRIRVSKAESVL